MIVSKEAEINQINVGKPHLVILGAGASLASLPNGDNNGKKLPLMNNFIETLGLQELLDTSGIEFDTNNFEEIYTWLRSLGFPADHTEYANLVEAGSGSLVISSFEVVNVSL